LEESALASKFSNTIRWPGETVISTSRLAKTIAGTAAGFPHGCYGVTAYGGGAVVNGQCTPTGSCCECMNAGCGGGQGGGHGTGHCQCYCNYGYGQTCCLHGGRARCGVAGAGFGVVEY
jgi:hypothetical protein